MTEKTIVVRCRGIILHDEKLLIVRHQGNTDYAALPGGHLEWGEDVVGCIRREIIEELGVEPVIGRLLYINNYNERGQQSVEFFFEIKNGGEYIGCEELVRSHAYELAEIRWISPAEGVKLLPKQLEEDFKNDEILKDEIRFIS